MNSDLKIHNHEIRVSVLFDLEIYYTPTNKQILKHETFFC